MPTILLPLNNTEHLKDWSMARDNQLREVLGAGLAAVIAPGVLSGGVFVKTAGFDGKIAAGSVFWHQGVPLTLAADAPHTVTTGYTPVYVWATITRTPGAVDDPEDLDTWSLAYQDTNTFAAPSADHFPVVTVPTDGSGILSASLDNYPPGKFVLCRAAPFDLYGHLSGLPAANQQVFRYRTVQPFTLPAGLPYSLIQADVAATGSTVLTIKKTTADGVTTTNIGTATFSASGKVAVLAAATDTAFARGDLLTVTAPASPDATLADIDCTFWGRL